MVAVISCSHFPDDERIYHREISTLHEKNYVIKYFTLSDLKTNLSQSGINHKNYNLSNLFQIFKTKATKNKRCGVRKNHDREIKI